MSIDKQWKERGVGDLKINIKPDNDGRTTARFLMRADGVHRIVLNSPILKETIVQDPAGGAPLGKHAIFLGFVEGKPTLMQVKVRRTCAFHSRKW
jgi:Ran-binding protein 3